jgi:hypothetical protein
MSQLEGDANERFRFRVWWESAADRMSATSMKSDDDTVVQAPGEATSLLPSEWQAFLSRSVLQASAK